MPTPPVSPPASVAPAAGATGTTKPKPSAASKANAAVAHSRALLSKHTTKAAAAYDTARGHCDRIAAHPHSQRAIAVGKVQVGRVRVALGRSEMVCAAEKALGVDRVALVAGAVAM